ncbi:MAG: FliI/YscN family ATPase [Chloroflexota bacterium]
MAKYHQALQYTDPFMYQGKVVQILGLVVEVEGVPSQIGDLCYIESQIRGNPLSAEVVGFKGERVMLMPLADLYGIRPGSKVVSRDRPFTVRVGEELKGRILDGMGQPMDGKGPIESRTLWPLTNLPPHPLGRRPIADALCTGIRAIDGVLTCGKGQRIGIFSGSGVGKSTLLGMIARNSSSDVNVVALIGERGREVREFVERDLGDDGLMRSVLVVSTSDQPALVRIKAAWVATAIAEYFRDQGADVSLLMDSVTRFAMGQREIGLAVGEPPVSKGYPPSLFATLPKLMERTGTSHKGNITSFYTVLVESDDLTEPLIDTVRSIVDGHIVLSRDLALENHYPAIDILNSLSRLMPSITSDEHQQTAGRLREVLATYEKAKDLINIGAYVRGSNPDIDYAMKVLPSIKSFLKQPSQETSPYQETLGKLKGIFSNKSTS